MTTTGSTRRGLLRFAAYTAVLYAGLVHNALCVPEDVLTTRGEFRAGRQAGDDVLVVNRLRRPDATTWGPLAFWRDGGWANYTSQFGLTGVLLGAAQRATGATPERVMVAANLAFGLATAALLAAFFASVAARVGPLAGHVGVVLAACSPPLLAFAPSVYWATPMLLTPFVLAWLAYPWAGRSAARFALLLAGVGGLVCLKCLCGYEYVTSVVLAPVAAVVYHRAAVGDGVRKWLLPAVAVVGVGLLGFAAAILLHASQLAAYTGGNGFDVIRERAANRTSVPDGEAQDAKRYPLRAPELAFVPEGLRRPVRGFVSYFYQPAFASPQTWGPARFAVPLWAVSAAAVAVLAGLWRVRQQSPAAAALAPAAAVGFAASVSWQVMALNHMYHHGHLNLIVFCVPFLPLAYAGFGSAVHLLGERRGWRRPGVQLGLALVAAVAVNAAVIDARPANRGRAEERVRAVLRGEEAAVSLEGRGFPPAVAPLPADPPYLPHESLFNGGCAPDENPHPLGAAGWVLAPREWSAAPPVTVVVVRGNEVVPARVGYFRLTDLEQTLPGGLRVCGVPGGDPGRRVRPRRAPAAVRRAVEARRAGHRADRRPLTGVTSRRVAAAVPQVRAGAARLRPPPARPARSPSAPARPWRGPTAGVGCRPVRGAAQAPCSTAGRGPA